MFLTVHRTNEAELVAFMRQYGQVQTCIVNHDKRHAFLKLASHQDAIATKASIEQLPDSEYRTLFERVCHISLCAACLLTLLDQLGRRLRSHPMCGLQHRTEHHSD